METNVNNELRENVKKFNKFWNREYSYISMELSDQKIAELIIDAILPEGEDGACDDWDEVIERAVHRGVDYSLANGLSEVQE